ncbi:MAG: hypothetical protein P8R31_10925 [Mariniblastus sp.]|nr:hypothetical protein [Mariniblastus sp.]
MRTQPNRRGFSLIQLTLLMPTLLVLFLVTAAWIHQTMTFSSNIKKQQSQHQNLTRLASQFRRDVQRCQSISMVNEQQICLQNRDLTEINYTVNEHAIQFWQNAADGQRIRHDQFDLASGSITKFDDTELPDWISLVISRLPSPNRFPKQPTSPSDQTSITELHIRSKPNRWGAHLLLDKESAQGGNDETTN